MDVSCVIIELKAGSLERVRAWANFIIANRNEALATLENESVTVESFFLLSLESKDYLVWGIYAAQVDGASSRGGKAVTF